MTSAWVLIIASVLHFGLRRSCFLNIEQLPMLADTLFARHIAYCAMLHFLYDQELLPARYRRRMGLLIGFLAELVLGVAFMELLGQWLWFRVEHMVHRCLLLAMRHYGNDLNPELGEYLEKAVMRGVMTSLAGLLWLNAYAATEPQVMPQVGATAKAGLVRPKQRSQPARRVKGQEQGSQQDQKQKLKQKLRQKMKLMLKQKADRKRVMLEQEKDKDKNKEQKQEQNPELPVPAEEVEEEQQQHHHLTALATASDC